MQYCKCTNDFVNAIIDDYFNSFKIRKDLTEGLVYEWTNLWSRYMIGIPMKKSLHLRNLHERQF